MTPARKEKDERTWWRRGVHVEDEMVKVIQRVIKLNPDRFPYELYTSDAWDCMNEQLWAQRENLA